VLSLDSSWDSLHKRGYRPIQSRAPLNESLAAGLLLHLGYTGSEPLADFMCGSGTFLIEGAWIAANRPPGLTRKWFGFMGWPNFDRAAWATMRDQARKAQKALPEQFTGSDIRDDAIRFADKNAKAAGVRNRLRLLISDLGESVAPTGRPGLLIVNPPYGERLGEERDLWGLYRAIGDRAASHWPGWRLAVFTMHESLAHAVNRPIVRRTPFYNGRLPCHIYEYAV
jgi:putative N6-adenine-specific DNA methylase